MLNSYSSRLAFILRSCLAVTLLITAVNAWGQITLEALGRAGYGMVPIQLPKPNLLVTPATINGKKVKLILDTGFSGEGIALDSAHARKLGLGEGTEKSEGVSATGKRVAFAKGGSGSVLLGNAQIEGVPIFFANMEGLRNWGSFQTGSHINRDSSLVADGFLSAGFLRTCSAVVDLHNRRLYLWPPGTGRRVALGPALTGLGLAAVPFTQAGGDCVTEVEINGAPARMIMDTGATLTSVDSQFAVQMKASRQYSGFDSRDIAGVKTEASQTSQTPVRSFKIAGVQVRAPEVQVKKLACYSASGGKVVGFLGMDILGQNWSIIDFGEQKLYIAAAR